MEAATARCARSGMAVIVNGAPEEIPGLHTVSWLDDPRLRLRAREDFHPRTTRWIRSVILHTTKGLPARAGDPPQQVLTGRGAPVNAGERVALYWSRDGRQAGAHLVVDHDGTVACCVDLLTEAAYHAGPVNTVSIGIELYQGGRGELYVGQLEAAVALVDWLTQRLGIQRQIPDRYLGGPIRRLELGGQDCIGVFGHRDVTSNRGPGDPGSAVFDALARAGYERWDFAAAQDRARWQARQEDMGMGRLVGVADGIPGPQTLARLKAVGRARGMWVPRPGDSAATVGLPADPEDRE